MKIALDTNILAYAEGTNGTEMKELAVRLVKRLPQSEVVVPIQTLGELYNVLVRKARRRPAHAREAILGWREAFLTIETSVAVLESAAGLASEHGLSIWDAVVLSAAAEAGCRLLLSEDLQNGFVWHGVTVANPFLANCHPLLRRLVEE
ncbi:MAG: PIN domain-containing protein [Bryobacteraceae bacterium]